MTRTVQIQGNALPTVSQLTKRTVEREIALLAALFDSAAMARSYGEDMSIRDHMLQCAEAAVARRLAPPMVVAALLHDVGWALDDNPAVHQHLAADLVEPLFGSAVAEPIRLHVDAKRYLVATRSEYKALLSAESCRTLTLQGGPMTPDESINFAARPGAGAALQLRLIDDAGKQLRPQVSSFATYALLLRSQMTRHLVGQ